jgi:serine/threonine protein kinase
MATSRAVTIRAPGGSQACVACGELVDDSRCGWCGIALTPGGFAVQGVLAQGPRGRVYRASDDSGRLVAIKELQFATVPTRQELDAFEREAETLKTLNHPAVPGFIKYFSDGSGAGLRLYLASEFINGISLSQRMARNALREHELFELAYQVLDVLSYLHKRTPPVLHRDIKPDNLVIRPNGTCLSSNSAAP